jgi:hypothetical protein
MPISCPDFSLLKRGATLNIDKLKNWAIGKLEYNIEICGQTRTIFIVHQPVLTTGLCWIAEPVVARRFTATVGTGSNQSGGFTGK